MDSERSSLIFYLRFAIAFSGSTASECCGEESSVNINNADKLKGDVAMSNIVSPSQQAEKMNPRQIEKILSDFRAQLVKHRTEFKQGATQQAITAEGFVAGLFAVFQNYYGKFANMFIRVVSVNRARTPEAAIAATGHVQYTDKAVVAAMPRGKGNKVTIMYFKLDLSERGGYISDDDLEKEFESHNLKPVDPFTLAADNEANSAFADEHPNATHWKDANGKWCHMAFLRWYDGKRNVVVDRHDGRWDDHWWFAGLASSPQN